MYLRSYGLYSHGLYRYARNSIISGRACVSACVCADAWVRAYTGGRAGGRAGGLVGVQARAAVIGRGRAPSPHHYYRQPTPLLQAGHTTITGRDWVRPRALRCFVARVCVVQSVSHACAHCRPAYIVMTYIVMAYIISDGLWICPYIYARAHIANWKSKGT